MELTPEAREAANRLVSDNLGLVQHVVQQLATRYPRHVDREELWNAGALGLVDASRRFDPARGIPFARYAVIRIRGAIVDATRARDWATRATRRALRRIEQATEAVRTASGGTPGDTEVAAHLGMELTRLLELRAAAVNATVLHLDQGIGTREGEEASLTDLLVEEHDDALPHAALERRELTGTLRLAVDRLPATQREVLVRYYFREEYLRDIAARLGVTQARASQIRAEALTSLRAYFAEAFGDVPAVDPDAPGRRARSAFLAEMATATAWRHRLAAADLELAASA
jgi:RNA polymerase sigma factor for flagellar operon FliA